MKITEKSTIGEVLKAAPKTRKVFERHGMGCRSCQGAMAETIALGAFNHGLDPARLVAELVEAARSED